MAKKKRQVTVKHSTDRCPVDRKTRARKKSSDPPKVGLVSAKAEPQHPPLAEDHTYLPPADAGVAPAEGPRLAGTQAGVCQQPSERQIPDHEQDSNKPSQSYCHVRDALHQLSQNQELNSKEGWVSHNRTIGAGCEEMNTQYAVRTPAPSEGSHGAGSQVEGTHGEPLMSIRHKRLSTVQKILVSCIVLIVAMLLYVLLRVPARRPPQADKSLSKPTREQIPALQGPADSKVSVEDREPPLMTRAPSDGPLPAQGQARPRESVEATSLKTAETFYLQKDFNKAYATYDQLRQGHLAGQEDPLKDFLQLKMAFCMKNAGDFDQAAQIFRMVSQSHYPLIRTVANYHLCLLEMQKEQYLNARRRAYQTMALISALTFDWQWTLTLARNCHFLIAESVTRHVLSLRDADKDCPAELWPTPSEADPFINLSEAELRRLLNCGSEQLRGALLSPQIQQLQSETLAPGFPQSGVPRWEISCHGASIEELLARFAAHADLDIHWAYPAPIESEMAGSTSGVSVSPSPEDNWGGVRKRPVSLYMSAATTQQFVTAAAGCAGLLARLDDEGTVKIFDPSNYASLSEHLALLAQEAVSLWQRFLLTFGDDEHICNAHFALGLLQAVACGDERITDAIAEYKLVANRYPRTSLAPLALLASSKLKVNLQDYLGAREDLKQLTEQYPDTEFSNQACLHLADATMKAGLLSEAAQLYCKVYNLGFSLQSQRVSALGAGRCFYQEASRGAGSQKDYENAAKWLTRYINLGCREVGIGNRESGIDPRTTNHKPRIPKETDRDFYLACLLLGKTYLAQDLPQQACNAFEIALSGKLAVQEYVETVSALVKAQLALGHFVEALKLLDSASASEAEIGQKESIEMILLEASVLRSMGLADEAIAVLGDKAEYVLDPQLKAKISFEQAKCSITKGNLELARKNLSEILVLVEPSATDGLADEVRCELADVCLKLGSDSQAISICLQLLDSDPKAPIKQKASDLLATAYTRQKNYDQAALAYLGQWVKDDTR